MAEDSLDIEKVEVVGARGFGRGVEDACGGASEIVGGDVAEACRLRTGGNDGEEGARLGRTVPVDSAGSAVAAAAENDWADKR